MKLGTETAAFINHLMSHSVGLKRPGKPIQTTYFQSGGYRHPGSAIQPNEQQSRDALLRARATIRVVEDAIRDMAINDPFRRIAP